MMARRKLLMMKHDDGLPSAYQAVSYLKTNGDNCYFVTDYYPNNNTGFWIKLKNTRANTDPYPMAISSGGIYNVSKISNNDEATYYTWRFTIGDATRQTSALGAYRRLVEFQLHGTDIKILRDDGTIYMTSLNQTLTPFQSIKPLIIFGLETENGIKSYCGNDAELYGLTLYEGNTIVRNYVPCYRKSDNEPGLYELKTRTFLTNDGDSTFTAVV